jgi:2-phosphosulfolactate phosphatase
VARSVDVLLAPPFTPEALRGAHVVAIDVLRATTTIVTALANGAAAVIPVLAPEDAVEVAKRLGRDRVLLCGERASVLIKGFDLDNSPASYAPEIVAGKTLVFTTTNGTRALRAGTTAASVRAGALVNRAAVADALAREQGEIALLCAGVHNRFALEDALGAGALVDALVAREPDLELRDGARAAALLYRAVAPRLAEAVASADHAHALAELGFGTDIERCATLDVLTTVPILRDGMFVAA